MGRPSLGFRKTTIRLSGKLFDRIEAIAGKGRVSDFIRKASEEVLKQEEEKRGMTIPPKE